ncbi:zinc ribbon domain-containing protein [Promethearchaeum syntrophicum]|uniref:Zinc ribbon domain-containing protein n=1 Tax=Promethearchaeum syntrophicum TaxID=2594042 RepID=A0A5B9DEV5_9ARCH|nr:zinc ribbon domain-containing protein [Candidatus Prometheoarchaeum syntrophicum]QEE17541.1 hypothetical protein DSAG12_03378 [Candidatus Prometheoarchaeum syntrophicum]
MNKKYSKDLSFRDLLIIIMLSLLQTTLITALLNNLIFQENFYLYAGLFAFLLFQLVFIFPPGYRQPNLNDFRILIKKIWPILLEIILEFAFFIYFKQKINNTGWESYSSGTITMFHHYSFVYHFILLIPLYTFCLWQFKNYQMKINIDNEAIPVSNKQFLQHLIMSLITIASPFAIYLLITELDVNSNWESEMVYFGCMLLPFILNLIVLKAFLPFSVFHPLNLIKLLILYLSWHWIVLWNVASVIIYYNSVFYQVLGLISILGMLILLYYFQLNLEKSCGLPIAAQLPENTHISNLEGKKELKLTNPQFNCPTCGNQLNSQMVKELSEENNIFCSYCGEKIRYQEVFQLPKEKILSKHQEILKKVQQSNSELNSHINNP